MRETLPFVVLQSEKCTRMIYRDAAVACRGKKANSNYVEYPIADLWGHSRKCTSGSFLSPITLSPSPPPFFPCSHGDPAALPTAVRHIAFTYELNYYTLLPTDRKAVARCPLNNEKIIHDKLSNGENGLNHA